MSATIFDGAIGSIMQTIVEARVLRELQEIEKACEESVQSGTHGVFVLRDGDGTLKSAKANRLVPYGQIYEFRDTSRWFTD